jgi:hypothetical protein
MFTQSISNNIKQYISYNKLWRNAINYVYRWLVGSDRDRKKKINQSHFSKYLYAF